MYSLSHEIFLTERTVFVLVWNLDKEPIEKETRLKDWMSCLTRSVPNAKIVLIGTHLDAFKTIWTGYFNGLDEEKVKSRIESMIEEAEKAQNELGGDSPLIKSVFLAVSLFSFSPFFNYLIVYSL